MLIQGRCEKPKEQRQQNWYKIRETPAMTMELLSQKEKCGVVGVNRVSFIQPFINIFVSNNSHVFLS